MGSEEAIPSNVQTGIRSFNGTTNPNNGIAAAAPNPVLPRTAYESTITTQQ